MKLERSNVEFPLWRKKVDKSIFEHNGTTIPLWACQMWGLQELFGKISSKRNPDSNITVRYEGSIYNGWVTTAQHGRSSPALRLWYEEDLTLKLKNTFLMSYMRALEQSLTDQTDSDIEKAIPFWEFIDIEFDKIERQFRFVAYYKQEPSFPHLFRRLIGSPSLRRIADEIEEKKERRIYKQDWKPRSELAYEIGARNVLYALLDTKNNLFYVGEAQDLVKRLSQPYPSIPHWEYYRYNVLPNELAPFRLALERMVIRDLAALLPNKKQIPYRSISNCTLVNEKVDK